METSLHRRLPGGMAIDATPLSDLFGSWEGTAQRLIFPNYPHHPHRPLSLYNMSAASIHSEVRRILALFVTLCMPSHQTDRIAGAQYPGGSHRSFVRHNMRVSNTGAILEYIIIMNAVFQPRLLSDPQIPAVPNSPRAPLPSMGVLPNLFFCPAILLTANAGQLDVRQANWTRKSVKQN